MTVSSVELFYPHHFGIHPVHNVSHHIFLVNIERWESTNSLGTAQGPAEIIGSPVWFKLTCLPFTLNMPYVLLDLTGCLNQQLQRLSSISRHCPVFFAYANPAKVGNLKANRSHTTRGIIGMNTPI